MADFLTYYYSIATEPFRCISALPDEEAIRIMEALYDQYQGSVAFDRFKDPAGYLRDRRRTEEWVRADFIAKGGRPRDVHPVSMVLGTSRWIEKNAPEPALHGEIRIPLDVLSAADVSFTFPDSMVSRWLADEKLPAYYRPEFHGIVFTLPEILSLVEKHGLPEENWEVALPPDTGSYIEAQVWNRELLLRHTPRPPGGH